MREARRAALALLFLLPAGCATVPRDPAARAAFRANHDPLEPMNRKIFAFNQALDRAAIKPLAKGYRRALPPKARDAIRHFIDNLNEPVVLGNTLLQGRYRAAGTAAARFVINTTVGLAGLVDIAAEWKLPEQIGDFGQTLWKWKVPSGPYLIIPIFGPSNPRDGIGMAVDAYYDPLRYIPNDQIYPSGATAVRIVVDGVDVRSRNLDSLEEIQRESIDYYASFRSLYWQNRAAELRGQRVPATLPGSDFYQDPGQ